MLKRSPLKRKAPPARESRQWTGHDIDTSSAPCRMAETVARMSVPVPKAAPLRSEAYRRLVAMLPCMQCGIQGYSQAAHPNTGKAKGAKASDLECFPLCADRVGIVGCHFRFDQHQLFPREQRAEVERRWIAATQARLENELRFLPGQPVRP